MTTKSSKKKNPKKVSVGDIMRFYVPDSQFSPEHWTDGNEHVIPHGTCGVVVDFQWLETDEYTGYDMSMQLPDGHITEGWGEYAVEPVYKQKRTGKIWYKNKFMKQVIIDE
jgi:hypothetical protein